MSTPVPRLDAITGALLIGTWASSLLYMAELLQAVYYFRNFKNDSRMLKSYVALVFTIDTISAIGNYACVYLYTITHAGDFVYLTKQNWGVPLYIISTSSVAILVQSFLVIRYWRFTNNTIIVCFVSILILAAFGGGIYSVLVVVLFPALKDRNKVRISGIVFLVTQVSADLIIAGALVRELMRNRSSFKGQRRTNNMLNRLISRTIHTGTMTAGIAVLALVIFLIDDETNIAVGIMYTSGRVYVLNMLLNLNIRDSGRSKNSTFSGGQQGGLEFAHSTTYNIGSAQFCHTSEPHSSNRGTVKSSWPTSQSTASISETQSPIEMTPIDAKQVPDV
ncbi:hypothetical protein C8R45DRAFT_1224282 [Mycena sanguinolenta]|nr:hypothetical protein C8R45DRAFT_1224282 [Mycena sanguinolenta]